MWVEAWNTLTLVSPYVWAVGATVWALVLWYDRLLLERITRTERDVYRACIQVLREDLAKYEAEDQAVWDTTLLDGLEDEPPYGR